MTTKSDYDVIIVGAGPAGSSCAKTLSENGVSTLLIDKNAFPRIKPCCGFLNDRTVKFVIEKYKNIPEEIICSNRSISFLWSATGRYYQEVKGYGKFLNVNRELFDGWLVKESNTEFIDGFEVKNVVNMEGKLLMECLSDEEKLVLKCNIIVFACGANSKFRRIYDLNYKASQCGACIQKVYSGELKNYNNDEYRICFNKKYTDNAFSFVYKKGNLTHIGSGWLSKYDNYFENWYAHLSSKYENNLQLIRTEKCCVENPIGTNGYYWGEGNKLFIGEAAGLIDAWGVGIPYALMSGYNAAITIVENRNNLVEIYKEKMVDEVKQINNTLGKEMRIRSLPPAPFSQRETGN